jgi:bifunctional non-homologous end joining protein LigD
MGEGLRTVNALFRQYPWLHTFPLVIESCLRNGILRFTLYGVRLKGGWMLARTKRNASRTVWTLAKLADRFIESTPDKSILEEQPNSIKSGGTMEEIVCDWGAPKNKYARQTRLFDET